jgi:hypothetical protein
MTINSFLRPAHRAPAQHQRPWRSPTVVLVAPRPGEWS